MKSFTTNSLLGVIGLISTTCGVVLDLALAQSVLQRSSKPHECKYLLNSIEKPKQQTRNESSMKDFELAHVTTEKLRKEGKEQQ